MKIHGHPQKLVYLDDGSDWPTLLGQAHWAPSENPINPEDGKPIVLDLANGTLGTSKLGHTHFDLTAPIYAEVSGPITCKFAIHLFHLAGGVNFDLDSQEGVKEIIWDATGTTTPPNLIGDINGETIYTGKLTFDPHINPRGVVLHGWFAPLLNVRTFLDNGDKYSLIMLANYWSMIDPSAPANDGPAYPQFSIRAAPFSARHPNDRWGINIVEGIGQYFPLAPINAPWPMRIQTFGYGGQLINAQFEQRLDMDLHHQNAGILLKSIVQTGDITTDIAFSPVQMGNGPHRQAFLRNQLSSEGNDAINTLLLWNVVVGDAPPPQTVVVPNVVGSTIEQAHITLTSVGLVESRTDVQSSQPVGTVVSQDPIKDTTVPKGSTVALGVSKGQATDTWKPVSPLFEQLFDSMGNPTNSFRMTANGKTKVL
jgi:hypothetical protein